MKIMESAENYLETILVLSQRFGTVRSVDVAHELNFSKPSVSIAMKKLREKNLIEFDENGAIRFLPEGRRIAEAVYDRHVTISKALQILGVDPLVAEADACKVEHVISEETYQSIRAHIKQYSKE